MQGFAFIFAAAQILYRNTFKKPAAERSRSVLKLGKRQRRMYYNNNIA